MTESVQEPSINLLLGCLYVQFRVWQSMHQETGCGETSRVNSMKNICDAIRLQSNWILLLHRIVRNAGQQTNFLQLNNSILLSKCEIVKKSRFFFCIIFIVFFLLILCIESCVAHKTRKHKIQTNLFIRKEPRKYSKILPPSIMKKEKRTLMQYWGN